MTTRRPPRPDCRYQEWLARVTRWGYRSVNGPILLMEHERQQVIVGVKPIRTRLVHKNAEPMPHSLIRKMPGNTPSPALGRPRGAQVSYATENKHSYGAYAALEKRIGALGR